MKLQITVDLDNSAFDYNPAVEIRRILQDYSDNIISFNDCNSNLYDINGNKTGEAITLD